MPVSHSRSINFLLTPSGNSWNFNKAPVELFCHNGFKITKTNTALKIKLNGEWFSIEASMTEICRMTKIL